MNEIPFLPFFEQLNVINPRFGWAAKLLMNGFKESGTAARRDQTKPIRGLVVDSLYGQLQPDEIDTFIATSEQLATNNQAMKIITDAVIQAHLPYGVRAVDQAELSQDILNILRTFPLYMRMKQLE